MNEARGSFDASQFVVDLGEACLGDRDGKLIMIRIYMDESGTHDGSPVVTVAAYAGQPKEWKEFIRKWNVAKRPIDVFHSTDCQNLRGEFTGWSEPERDELVVRLMAVLRQSPFVGQAAGINLLDYNEALTGKEHLKGLFGTPYAASFQWVVATILDAVERHGTNEALAFFHEQNDFFTEAKVSFDWLKANRRKHTGPMTLTPATKAELVPLQAADVLAYEANKRLRNPDSRVRRSLEALDPDKRRISIRAFTRRNMGWLIKRLEDMHEDTKIFGKPVTFLSDDADC